MVLNENSIVSEHLLERGGQMNLKELTAIYNDIISKNKFDFILIDLDNSQMRHNFLEII